MVFTDRGRKESNSEAPQWATRAADYGAGEILVNSIDQDGTGDGFDIDLINAVVDSVSIPVIACGGAGEWYDFGDVLKLTNADAVAAANIFQYKDQSVYLCKNAF